MQIIKLFCYILKKSKYSAKSLHIGLLTLCNQLFKNEKIGYSNSCNPSDREA